MEKLTKQEVETLNSLRDSLEELMLEKSNGLPKYSVKYVLHCTTILRKIIESNGGNIQQ